MTALHAVAGLPVAGIRRTTPVASSLAATVSDPRSNVVWLAEIAAWKGSTSGLGSIMGPVAGAPVAGMTPGATPDSGLVTIAMSDRGWIGEPADASKASIHYEPRLAVPMALERSIPILPEESRRGTQSVGGMELINADGALDVYVRSYAINGRRVRLLLGPGPDANGYPAAYSAFSLVASLWGDQWSQDDLRVRVGLRGADWLLAQPVQTRLYGGTGGTDGNAAAEGRPRPIALGKTRNVSPPLIDDSLLLYQLNDGKIQAVDAVYDRGAALTLDADWASAALLVAAGVAANKYATSLADGYMRLGSSPAGLITADLQGDSASGYVDTHGAVALRILRERAGLTAVDIDEGSFSALPTGTMGIWIADPVTTAEVLEVVLTSISAFHREQRDGRITAGRLVEPTTRDPLLVLDSTNTYAVQRLDPPAVPRWRQRVGYQVNWTVQRGEDLAGSVTAARRQFLAEQRRVEILTASGVQTRYPLAPDREPLLSLFDDVADAGALCDTLIDLHSVDRVMARVTIGRIGYTVDFGYPVQLTWPVAGLSTARVMAVVGIRDDADRGTVTLTLWG